MHAGVGLLHLGHTSRATCTALRIAREAPGSMIFEGSAMMQSTPKTSAMLLLACEISAPQPDGAAAESEARLERVEV
jgi:hypothetical protein